MARLPRNLPWRRLAAIVMPALVALSLPLGASATNRPPSISTNPSVSDSTPRDEEALVGNYGSWNGSTPMTFTITWQRCDSSGCSTIAGAVTQAYTVVPADVGKRLRVTVVARNAYGQASATSAQTSTVAPVSPTSVTPPIETGTAIQGQTLSTTLGTWIGTPTIAYGYRWKRCDSAGNGCGTITGATSQTYVLQNADIGSTVRSYVTATNAAGATSKLSVQSALVAAAPPVAVTAPSVSDSTPVQDETITAQPGTWSGTLPIAMTFAWQRCDASGQGCSSISGQTGMTYTAGAGDVGSTLRFRVTASNLGGTVAASSSATAVVLSASARPGTTAAYRAVVLADAPVAFWPLDETSGLTVHDAAGSHSGTLFGSPTLGQLGPFGAGSLAMRMNGTSAYAQIPTSSSFSIPTTHSLTVEAWIRPDALTFPDEEASGYVYAFGKGDAGKMEWAVRVYGADNTESPSRQNRICLYVWNPAGGEGAGAYFQDPVTPGQWIHVVAEATPTGVRIYKNGILRMTDDPASPLYSVAATYADPTHPVTPVAGNSPLRIGTRNMMSIFKGGIAGVAIYTHLLSDAEVSSHYLAAMSG